MGKKRAAKVVEEKPEVWCFYCERDFEDERILIQHQKAKHFKCDFCHKKLTTAGGLVVHCLQVHKETVSKVPNAKPEKESVEYEIYGMAGIPDEFLSDAAKERKKQDNQQPQAAMPAPMSGGYMGQPPHNPYMNMQFNLSMGQPPGMSFGLPPPLPPPHMQQFQQPGQVPPPPMPNSYPNQQPSFTPLPPQFNQQQQQQFMPPLVGRMPPPMPPRFPPSMPMSGMLAPALPPSMYQQPLNPQMLPPPPNGAYSSDTYLAPPQPLDQQYAGSTSEGNNTSQQNGSILPAPTQAPPAAASTDVNLINLIWTDEEFCMEEIRARLPKYKVNITDHISAQPITLQSYAVF